MSRAKIETAITWPFLAAAAVFMLLAALIASTLPCRGWIHMPKGCGRG
jgi:hypothetical protein